MYRSVARRLTAWFVFVTVGLLLIVALLLTAFAFRVAGRSDNDAINSAAQEAPALVALYQARHESLEQAAPDIIRQLSRPGIHVLVFKDGSHEPIAPGPPPADSFRSQRFIFMLSSLLGIHFERIPVPGGAIGIVPENERLMSVTKTYLLGFVPLFVIVTILVWLLGRYITGQAIRPLVEVTAALERLAGGDITPGQISAAERGEFGELTVAYNKAAAQVSAAFDERRRTESEMRQFIADAAHELRTPLTVVMGYIDVLQKGASNDPELNTRIFDAMTSESRRMRMLIDKLIVLARLERPEPPNLVLLDAAQVAGHVVDTFKPLPAGERIRIEAAPGALVHADETELHEAIANLLDNALKYAPQSPIDVSVRTDNGAVVLRVADRGPGLTPEEQAHIFDRFYRGTERGDLDGSGLGLAIAKRVVERANGTIAVNSQPGEGTQFVIRLPRSA